MEFTYKGYERLIDCLKDNGYSFADYKNYGDYDKCVILRHDVDYDLQKVTKMAEIEYEKGVSSTYFVLLTSEFYNVMSKNSGNVIKKLYQLGHQVGLHFDEKFYEISEATWNETTITCLINHEIALLSDIVGRKTNAVSMHRPSKKMLESDFKFAGGAENSYGKEFFSDFKYLSDSRMRWREDVEHVIGSGEYDRIQLLTHPFWYFDKQKEMRDIVEDFIYCRKEIADYRYKVLNENITDLCNILNRSPQEARA